MKTIKPLALATLAMLLSACAGFQDVHHKWCPPEEKQTIELEADALFKFDRFGVNDMLPEGRTKLDKLVTQFNEGKAQIQRIEITGYTDRLGSEQYNYELGLRRAETVKQYLAGEGVQATMNTKSAGETQPVVQCDGPNNAKLRACLQPNRRVVLDIYGHK